MPCYGPLTAYYAGQRNPSGKRSLTFRKQGSYSGVEIQVPCGQCIGCKLERSRQWALRCLHESRSHNSSCFVTLTYEDSRLPAFSSLELGELQRFMKRLRKQRPPGLRFYACGEYGDLTLRPHYHVLLLNTSFPDMRKMSWGLSAPSEHETFASAELSTLWPLGQSVIGQVTFESCAYVARYCTKVITGDGAEKHYGGRAREFCVMSRRPGIGLDWYTRYGSEWYKHDSVVVENREAGIPRYYDTKLKDSDPVLLSKLKRARRRAVIALGKETSRRRWTKERVALLTMQHFKRDQLR